MLLVAETKLPIFRTPPLVVDGAIILRRFCADWPEAGLAAGGVGMGGGASGSAVAGAIAAVAVAIVTGSAAAGGGSDMTLEIAQGTLSHSHWWSLNAA